MSEYSSKTLRGKMKDKAKRLASPGNYSKDQEVSSADWSPAAPINADVKTGLRPVSPRNYKRGGAVKRAEGGATKGSKWTDEFINRNVKSANAERPGGKDHVGALKKGGKVKRASGGLAEELSKPVSDLRTRLSREDRRRKEMEPDSKGSGMLSGLLGKRHGGKIKRATGGNVPSDKETQTDKARIGTEKIKPVRAKAEHYKKGGKIKRACGGYDDGGRLPSPEEAIGSEVRMKGLKVMPSQSASKAAMVPPSTLRREEGYAAADMKAKRPGRKDGGAKWIQSAIKKPGALHKQLGVPAGEKIPAKKLAKAADKPGKLGQRARLAETLKGLRKGRATGGAADASPLSTAAKSVRDGRATGGRKSGKTDIKINILAGGAKPPMPGAMMPPPVVPMLPPTGGPGAGPAPMPPAAVPAAGLPTQGIPMGRKAGGRITKVAKSYKDMQAGSASGEGRLQKTDIAKLHKDAPSRKSGGKVRGK